MDIHLDYGKTGLVVTLPGNADVTIVEPQFVEGVADQVEAVLAAIQTPIGSPPLREIVKPGDTVGIIFYDITRPTPDHIMIPVLLEEVEAAGIAREQVTLFNATGTHRINTDEELRSMLGDEVVDTCHIVQNDAHDRDSHLLVGTTSSGNDIWIHKRFVEADVYVYSDGLDNETIVDVMLLPCENIEMTVTELLEKYGSGTKICVLPEGPQTIPYVT